MELKRAAAAAMAPMPLASNPSDDGGPSIVAATTLLAALGTITVFARLYVRFFMIRNSGWDDWFMILSLALSWVGQGFIYASVAHGAGRHVGDVDPAVYAMGMRSNFISQPIFLIAICTVKMAVGTSLLRIASTKFYRRLILSIMVFMGVYTIICFFTLFFQCTDLRIMWDHTVKATCWSSRTLGALGYTNATLNIVTDLLFAVVIPAPMLWNLNVRMRTRVTLLGILGLGVFCCAAAFVKLGYIIESYGYLTDFLWTSRNITIWTTVELNIGIMAGSLPTLRPLFKTILGSTYGTGSRKTPASGATPAYGRGTLRSGNNWQSLSSGRRRGGGVEELGDDTSSQKAINVHNVYEMTGGQTGGHTTGPTHKTTILSQRDAHSSDDSLDRTNSPRNFAGGITKTIETSVEITK